MSDEEKSPNELKIRKVHLETFIGLLMNLSEKGVEYVDIFGTTDDVQDVVGLSYSKEYMMEEKKHEFENLHKLKKMVEEDDEEEDNSSDSDEDDLNQIII